MAKVSDLFNHIPLKLPSRRIRNVNKEHRQSLSGLDRVAVWVTEQVGSMGFFIIILLWTAGWFLWNTLAPIELRFDPFPAFVLWLFISNLIQLTLLPLIMVGQNLQGRHAELRAQADYEINKQAEQEVKAIIAHLERQHETMLKILKHFESHKK